MFETTLKHRCCHRYKYRPGMEPTAKQALKTDCPDCRREQADLDWAAARKAGSDAPAPR